MKGKRKKGGGVGCIAKVVNGCGAHAPVPRPVLWAGKTREDAAKLSLLGTKLGEGVGLPDIPASDQPSQSPSLR